MLYTILIVVAVVIAAFLLIAAMQPAEFRVARSATVAAPAPTVFNQINDFHNWEAWSPWAKLDPNAKNTYSCAASGVGALFAWAGNNKVGEGRMSIVESQPSNLIRIKLNFEKPFKAENLAEFTLESQGQQTQVTWAMTGKRNFLMKAMGLFMNCEKMIGPCFEKGLANLNQVSITSSHKQHAVA